MKRTILILLILFALLLTACKGDTQPTESHTRPKQATPVSDGFYKNISVEELQKMLVSKDFTFVNVHIPFEGDIAVTDLSIPYNEIEQNLERLPADKKAKIVLYYRSGRMMGERSSPSISAETLVGLGYTNVWNLEGGMIAWEEAGLPLLRK